MEALSTQVRTQMKNADTRITETLAFIKDTVLVKFSDRLFIEKYLGDYLLATFPNKTSPQYKAFSDDLSMNSVANAGNEQERMLRRLLVLMWKVMGNAGKATAAKTMPVALLAPHLYNSIPKAMICAGIRSSDQGPARYVLEQLFRVNPASFLNDNAIMISGSTRNSGLAQNVLSFQFGYDALSDRYVFKPSTLPEAGFYVFDAVSIPAVNWWDVPGRGNILNNGSFAQIHGTELSGSTIMLTTQFTGCSFCMKEHLGHLYAAHISPASVLSEHATYKTNGLALARQICGEIATVAAGDFGNAAGGLGPFRVYGRDKGNAGFPGGYPFTSSSLDYCCIIGFETNGNWSLYCQHSAQQKVVGTVHGIFP
jgi:hypothetical protein